MKIFCTDLDNTMIYSYKHDIGNNKRNVELYQGREISFITEKSYQLMKEVREKVLMIPTTTRTNEQYERIDLGIGSFPYAMTCNGGVLLVDGQEDDEWYQESLKLIEESREELRKAEHLLEQEESRSFEVRNIKDLFLFTKCDKPEEAIEHLKSLLDLSVLDVFSNGIKVYAVPKKLSKGNAVKRIAQKLKADFVICAGDSEFDITMLQEADMGLAPYELECGEKNKEHIYHMPQNKLFSEELLQYILNCINE